MTAIFEFQGPFDTTQGYTLDLTERILFKGAMWRRQEGEGKRGGESGGEGGGDEMAAIIAGTVAPEDNPFQNPGVIAADWVGFIAVR